MKAAGQTATISDQTARGQLQPVGVAPQIDKKQAAVVAKAET